jgi:3,4-dihydroxy 2-butanone 4-phosphate synthase / GTP cyclohydrolase II
VHAGQTEASVDLARIADLKPAHSVRSHAERGENVERTLRQFGLGSQILSDLGVQKIRLLTNTPTRVPVLHRFNLEIVECVPLSSAGKVNVKVDALLKTYALNAL